MKRIFLIVLLLLFCATSAFGAADASATAKTQALLTYMTNLYANGKVLSGQTEDTSSAPGGTNTYALGVYAIAGKYPAIIGREFAWNGMTQANVETQANSLVAYAAAGGGDIIVRIVSHFNNPATGGTSMDITTVDLVKLITPGEALNTTFNGYLDKVAAGIQILETANVPVIYGPLHESSGCPNVFWWGCKNATQYINLYKYVQTYMNTTKGLHNILWLYAPNHYGNVTTYYPGSAYIDIVGLDTYPEAFSDLCGSTMLSYYTALTALNKPFGLSEFGPCSGSGCTPGQDMNAYMVAAMNCMPKLSYWINWDEEWAMMEHINVATLLNNSKVYTRDEVAYYGTTTAKLTIYKSGTGTGTVTSSPSGISCGATCSFDFQATPTPTSVALNVTTTDTFTGWSGGGCSGTGTCTVVMNAATSVTATFTAAAASSTHWVSSSGTAAWASCAGATDPGVYCSLGTANSSAVCGETIYIKPGTYTTSIVPAASCSSASARITYAKTLTEAKPTIVGFGTAVELNNKSYIKIDGLIITPTAIWGYEGVSLNYNSHYNEVTNCEITTGSGRTILIGTGSASNHNWIHNNYLTGEGSSGVCGEGSDNIRLGIDWGSVYSTNNTLENNVIIHGGHGTLDSYSHRYTVLRNNISRNEPWHTGQDGCPQGWTPDYTIGAWHNKWGHRNIQIGFNADSSNLLALVEGNRVGYAGVNPANDGNANYELAGRGILFRYNSSYGSTGRGFDFKYVNAAGNGLGGTNCRAYNNTSYSEGKTFTGGADVAGNPGHLLVGMLLINSNDAATLNVVKNNLIYDNAHGDLMGCQGVYPYACSSAIFASYSTTSTNFCTVAGTGCTVTGDPLFTTPTITDYESQNLFADKAGYAATPLPDLTLQAASGAIDTGTHLTTAVGAGTNSTALVVADALYFQDGTWGSDLVRAYGTFQADYIIVGAAVDITKAVKIGSINYTTNTITLSSVRSWSNGDKVWLYKKSDGTVVLAGTAPDIGAHEYATPAAGDVTAPVRGADDLAATALSYPAINLNWSAFTDAVGVTGYRIYRCLGTGCTPPSVQTGVSATTSYQDTNLTASTVYGYTVKAVDAAGNLSLALTTAYATTPAASTNIELEDAGSCTLVAPMVSTADELASGGYYVKTTTASSGTATCTFNITEDGVYKIVGGVYGASAATDSFSVAITGVAANDAWHLNPASDPLQRSVYYERELNAQGTGTAAAPQYDPLLLTLTAAGSPYTIIFTGREAGARLDYFRVEKVSVTEQFALTYTQAGTGTGTVVINGVNCSASCAYNYDAGTPVTITGTAGGDSTFDGWSGGLCAGTAPCSFAMTEARAVTGTFTLNAPLYTLTITKAGTGLGTVTSSPTGIDYGETGAFDFTENEVVTLTATPNVGSTFTGWSGTGLCTGTSTHAITMSAAKACTATFARVTTPTVGTNFTLTFGGTMASGAPKITLVK